MNEDKKSVYVLGAEDGLILGPIMSAAMVLFGAMSYVPIYVIPALLAFLVVPIVAYLRLGRTYRRQGGTFSALWLQGICMFFFGGLIMSVVIYAALTWWVPGFMMHQINSVIEIYGTLDNPSADQIVDTLEKAKSAGLLPTALDVALQMLYIAVFTGSILSMFYAFLIRKFNRNKF